MSEPQAAILPGERLHLQHGPIDLVIGVDGDRMEAFRLALGRFRSVLAEIVEELPLLRAPVGNAPLPEGVVARRMANAVAPHARVFVTPMAAVAGAVADEVLAAMAGAGMRRAYVNNGGDIALRLAPGEIYQARIASLDGREHGRITVRAEDGVGGIATSGLGGRSLTMGIADAVAVLARTAAGADAAATLIGNAVDLPGHPGVHRRPANRVEDDSELGERPVVVHRDPLDREDVRLALTAGLAEALRMQEAGLILSASLVLQGEMVALPARTAPALALEASVA
jgi:ApbE superfamily uncharacterized protein (UPF0280 family)